MLRKVVILCVKCSLQRRCISLYWLSLVNKLIQSMGLKILQVGLVLCLAVMGSALSCATNQYYNSDISCLDCPQNCSTCANGQFCTSCNNGFYLVSNSFSVTCQTCSQIFIGCNTCLANVACLNCNPGYFLNGGACSLCSLKNTFCAFCSSDGSSCTQCSYPFTLVDGVCVSATVSAITGGLTGSGYSNSSSNTSSNSSGGDTSKYVTLANGTRVPAVYDANGCNQVQIYFQGKCLQAISNCIYYQINGLCGYCASGYVVTIFGDCSISNRILKCDAGYWVNTNLDVCVKANPACDAFYTNNGSCINCSTGYRWVNQTCIPNAICSTRQYFYQGVCIDVPAACTSFTSSGLCKSCTQGFELKEGICAVSQSSILANSCNFPCKTCHQYNKDFCFSCVVYYQLVGAQYGSCVAVPS